MLTFFLRARAIRRDRGAVGALVKARSERTLRPAWIASISLVSTRTRVLLTPSTSATVSVERGGVVITIRPLMRPRYAQGVVMSMRTGLYPVEYTSISTTPHPALSPEGRG